MDFSEETMWVIPKFSPLQLLLNMTIKLILNMALRLKIAKTVVSIFHIKCLTFLVNNFNQRMSVENGKVGSLKSIKENQKYASAALRMNL
ncbi:hypothetical protein T12_2216 [Trichinella patagoniensis]|uniref:Uncharacterized protein n=1 Tax=Trichinella patagoniensis TaxID=990121 RepID=A0A0V0Z8D8_9BILA|nr:hypothetical protein T12_2216 [Trichinella patagoniensis]